MTDNKYDPALMATSYMEKEYMEQARPILYKYKVDQIATIEDVKNFIKEMGVSLVLYPGQTFEQINKDPNFWEEVVLPQEAYATPSNI